MGCLQAPECVLGLHECMPPLFDNKGCRMANDPSCGEGQQFCVGSFDSSGCPQPGSCIPADCVCPSPTYDRNGCPLALFEAFCNDSTEIKCEMGMVMPKQLK